MEMISLLEFPLDKIYVVLEKDFRETMIQDALKDLNLKNYFELSKWINSQSYKTKKYNGGDIKRWVLGENLDSRTGITHPKYMPLWVVKEFVNLLGINKEILHKRVVSYRAGGRGSEVFNPNLPIKVTPEFGSIAIHLFCDGYVGTSPSYYQKKKVDRSLFVEKLKKVFGEFNETINEKKYQVRFPKAITDILTKYYEIESFLSSKARIPKKITDANKDHKLAGLAAFILDEGHIRDMVHMYSSNKKFLVQVKQLAESLNYDCKKIKTHKVGNYYTLTLANQCINNFFLDINNLGAKHPTCSLGSKHIKLKNIVIRRSKRNPSNYKLTDKIILAQIKEQELSTSEIAEKIRYANCTVLHHLQTLKQQNKVLSRRINQGYVWRKSLQA